MRPFAASRRQLLHVHLQAAWDLPSKVNQSGSLVQTDSLVKHSRVRLNCTKKLERMQPKNRHQSNLIKCRWIVESFIECMLWWVHDVIVTTGLRVNNTFRLTVLCCHIMFKDAMCWVVISSSDWCSLGHCVRPSEPAVPVQLVASKRLPQRHWQTCRLKPG